MITKAINIIQKEYTIRVYFIAYMYLADQILGLYH